MGGVGWVVSGARVEFHWAGPESVASTVCWVWQRDEAKHDGVTGGGTQGRRQASVRVHRDAVRSR